MNEPLSDATRLHFILGDPIAQAQLRAGVAQAFAERGQPVMVVPAHVAPAHLSAWLSGLSHTQNVDGMIVAVPHTFAAFGLCASSSERARFLREVNVMLRGADGSWYGDMMVGLGCVAAMRDKGCEPDGKRALLIGAGGRGAAIAHALLLAGISNLVLADRSALRRTTLIDRLNWLKLALVTHETSDLAGYDIVVNASPAGTDAGEPYPADVTALNPKTFVGCVMPGPTLSPLIAAARTQGCATVTGDDMLACERELTVNFLLDRH